MKLSPCLSRSTFYAALTLATLSLEPATAATITGTITDISATPLNTKLLFSPTNEVLICSNGICAGPARILDTTNGAFSLTLEAGNYTVTLPSIACRKPFCIYVPITNATLDITNLVRPCPCTNTGIPFHANLNQVISWSTNGERSLVDTNITIPAGTLHTGSVLRFEAFGSFGEPANNSPNATFALKLGATTLVPVARPATSASWHLSASITFRTVGPAAVAIGSIACIQNNLALDPFFFASQTATVDTTVPLTVDLTARYVDIAHTESISCEQLTLHLD
jgi:hypothetical protein